MPYKKIFAFLLLLPSFSAGADDSMENAKNNLSAILPQNVQIDSIEPSAMEGTYAVTLGAQVLFVRSVGEFIMVGDVYDTARGVNIAEEFKNAQFAAAVGDIPESEMVVMSGPAKRYVTVFTDTDCHFCQLFHKTVPDLEQRGIQVRYLMFPRAGLESPSYREAVSVWCSDNAPEAMTVAKAGGSVPEKQCDNPVAEQFQLGQRIGVRGTPTMILDNGKVITGYLSADELAAEFAGE